MGKYNLPPDKLAEIEVTEVTGYGEYAHVTTTKGLTQEQWNNLSEEQQKQYYIKYAGDPGKPTDVSLTREHQPEGKETWDLEAEDGFEVDPQELRSLANKMEGELDQWKSTLNKVGATQISASMIGGTDAAENFETMSGKARDGFTNYVGRIQAAYQGVIGRLRATADSYETAHGNTKRTVDGVNVTPSGNADL